MIDMIVGPGTMSGTFSGILEAADLLRQLLSETEVSGTPSHGALDSGRIDPETTLGVQCGGTDREGAPASWLVRTGKPLDG